jgi:predicted MFS family arabinose efflux permease
MFYPIIIVFLILTIGWRLTWFSSSIFVFVILGLSFYFLLRNNNFKIEKNLNNNTEFQQVSWRRRDVLKDTKFYIYLPLSLLMSFTVTGFLFHQVFIADIKSWTMMNLAQSFIFFAVSGLIGSIFSGLLVDKFTGRKLIPFHLIPMALILVSLLFSNHVYILYLYMAGLGFSNGFTENISNSLWAEMYGVNNLGSIKALLTFFGVLASASSPFLYGILLDQTNSINILVYLSLTLILIFSMMAYIGKKF